MIFVKVNNDKIVIETMIADQAFMDSYIDTTPGTWLETKEDGSIRKNHAGIGYTYDAQNDAFISPQPYNSWTLNNTTFQWEAPTPCPVNEFNYTWNETDQQWNQRSGTE